MKTLEKNLRKIKGCTYKITNISHAMCPSVSGAISMLRHNTFTLKRLGLQL